MPMTAIAISTIVMSKMIAQNMVWVSLQGFGLVGDLLTLLKQIVGEKKGD